MKKILVTIIIALSICSCKKIVLGENEKNNPENNFELLWKDFDAHYSLFDVRSIKWDSLYNYYRPKVTAQTTNDELWDICCQMIEELDDSHTYIYRPDLDSFYVSGVKLNNQALEEFNLDLISNKYLNSLTNVSKDREFSYGSIKDKDIGYIYLGQEEGVDPNKIDEVIDKLKTHKAIILDIRNNGGGDDLFGARIAGAFCDEEKFVYSVQTRNGKNHTDFDEKAFKFSKKQGDEQFLKPVIVLTDRYTISAGEVMLIYLKSFNHITQIGDTTAGDFSTTSNNRFLPNSWTYQYSNQLFLLPDGSSLDGLGHVPAVYIKNTKVNIANNEDKVMEEAINYLFVRYGIE